MPSIWRTFNCELVAQHLGAGLAAAATHAEPHCAAAAAAAAAVVSSHVTAIMILIVTRALGEEAV